MPAQIASSFSLFAAAAIACSPLVAGGAELPKRIVTPKATYINPRVVHLGDRILKISHEAGIANILLSDLPADVCLALNIPFSGGPKITLPSPFKAGGVTYESAQLLSVDPDGIRISHASGSAKVRYEHLSHDITAQLGGFNFEAAAAFRESVALQQQQAHSAIADTKQAMNAPGLGPSPTDPSSNNQSQQTEGPVSVGPSITMVGKTVSMGREVTTTWSTSWGSYQKTGNSRRCVALTVSTVARRPQQATVEMLFLWRNKDNRDLEVISVGSDTAVVVDGHPKVLTIETAESDTDEKYVILGIREKSGRRYLGWVARAKDANGQIVAACASVPHYVRYAYEVK